MTSMGSEMRWPWLKPQRATEPIELLRCAQKIEKELHELLFELRSEAERTEHEDADADRSD